MEEKKPERPLECSECRRPIAIRYTECFLGTVNEWSMCNDCPEYRKKIFGIDSSQACGAAANLDLACGTCGTTLDMVKKGTLLGCANCYLVFQEEIFTELIAAKRLPKRIDQWKRAIPLHIGRTPQEGQEVSAAMKLLALNEALSETLKAENYEQAALLRDKIRELTEKNPQLQEKPKTP